MNKEFFRGMKEQIEPDEEQVEELKNKLKNTAAVSRKPMWIGGVCAAALCVAVVLLGDGAGLKDIVFQFLLRAPGVQHQKSDEEHPLVLALQFLQKRLGISAVSRQI